MKKVAILGSTGSIGTQALDVISENPDRFEVSVLTCGKNAKLLDEQIAKFHPKMVVTQSEDDAIKIQKKYKGLDVSYGSSGLIDAAEYESDILLNSLMGMRGLIPTCRAVEKGKDIALANKETLVAGGEIVMDMVRKHGVKLLPVDSEHSAIFQCLMGNEGKKINRILLTASGGPFRGYTEEELSEVTLAKALKHPKWTMGQKITIDSATMMNKGLEVIEAKWLFDVPLDDIQILVHPQSIVHSAVEFEDTSVIAQLGLPDMRIPISVALGYPERLSYSGKGLNFFEEGANLTFEKPDPKVFKCINIAYESSRAGKSYPVVMNAANEVLVDMFLKEKIGFTDIPKYIEKVLEAHSPVKSVTLDDITEADSWARAKTKELLGL